MLELLKAILLTIQAADGRISGRTAIQKLVYFETVKNITRAEYRPHYYGPYSEEVANAIQTLVALKFLKEEEVSYGIEPRPWRVFKYEMSDEGKKAVEQISSENAKEYEQIKSVVETSKNVVGLDANAMSLAAKAYFVLLKGKHAMTCEEIKKDAIDYGWKIPGEVSIDKAVDLLNELGLCKPCTI